MTEEGRFGRLRNWVAGKLSKRAEPIPSNPTPEQQRYIHSREELLRRAREATSDIRVLTHAHIGHPYFDVLPDIFATASPQVSVKAILVVPDKDMKPTDPRVIAIKKIAEAVEKRRAEEKKQKLPQ